MDYWVYTDGACNQKKNKFASAYLVQTDTKYIKLAACSFDGSSIAVAETLAIGLAAEYILENCDLSVKDKVTVYTDSQSAVNYLKGIREGVKSPETKDQRVAMAWQILMKLYETCEVSIKKIRAHKSTGNGNQVADRLAKKKLRAAVEKAPYRKTSYIRG